MKQWEKSLYEGLLYLGETVFEGMYHNLTDTEIEIVSVSDPFQEYKLESIKKKLKIKSVNGHLSRLVDKNILKKKQCGIYSLNDNMFKEFLNIIISAENHKNTL